MNHRDRTRLILWGVMPEPPPRRFRPRRDRLYVAAPTRETIMNESNAPQSTPAALDAAYCPRCGGVPAGVLQRVHAVSHILPSDGRRGGPPDGSGRWRYNGTTVLHPAADYETVRSGIGRCMLVCSACTHEYQAPPLMFPSDECLFDHARANLPEMGLQPFGTFGGPVGTEGHLERYHCPDCGATMARKVPR